MRKIVLLALATVLFSVTAIGQSFRGLDRSPLDIAYLPDNFAHDRIGDQKAIIRITYSRPQKKGRDVLGGIVPFGQVWRTGANEATEIKVYQDITIGGKKLNAGTYSMFAIPDKEEWTLIFNSDLDYWGAYSYNEENDVLRVTASAKQIEATVEAFVIQFESSAANRATLTLAWDRTMVEVPVEY